MVHLPRVGETFDRYRIDSQVGFGGMGVVFAATDLRLGRQVALKVIGAQHAANEEFRIRFEREADIMTRLDSPHVLSIFDHGVHDGIPWLSTQLVSGGDLGTLLKGGEGLELGEAATIVGQVAGALHDAHRAGVVHRDVKPSNVLLRGDSAEPHTYLCDFGIAHSGGSGLTATGNVAGSWAYIAPERTTGDPGSPASDIYSLGCLLWACLTGRPPYTGADVEVALAQVRAPVPQLVGHDEVTARVNAVLRKALAKDPAERHTTAEELRRDLVELSRLDASGFTATPPPDLQHSGTGTGTTMRRTGAAPDAPLSSRPSGPSGPSRRRKGLLLGVTLALVVGAGGLTAVKLLGDGDGGAESKLGGGVAGDVDGDGLGDLTFRWYDYGDDYTPSRDLFVRSTGEGYDAPEDLPPLEGLPTAGDVDGDGRTDRVGIDNVTGTETVVVNTTLADGTTREIQWDPHGLRSDAMPHLGDLNGDGRDDLILSTSIRQDVDGAHGIDIEVALSDKEGFGEPTSWFREPEWTQFNDHLVPGDIDGDGTDELMVRTTEDNSPGAKPPKVSRLNLLRADESGFSRVGEPVDVDDDVALNAYFDIGDVDGDDQGEIVTFINGKKTGNVLVMEVEDDQIQPGTVWLKQPVKGYLDTPMGRFLTDVDGDGLSDLVLLPGQGKRSFAVTVALAAEDRFEAPRTWAEVACRNDPCDENWTILRSGT